MKMMAPGRRAVEIDQRRLRRSALQAALGPGMSGPTISPGQAPPETSKRRPTSKEPRNALRPRTHETRNVVTPRPRLSRFRQNATTTHLDTTPTEREGTARLCPLRTPRFQCFATIALAGEFIDYYENKHGRHARRRRSLQAVLKRSGVKVPHAGA